MPAEVVNTTTAFNQEVIMLIIGAVLGLMASLFTMVVQRWLDKKGKLHIFYRFSYQRGMGGRSWGFEDNNNGKPYFVIPVVYEFQNTSNTTRVIRDVSLLLYNGKTLVANMEQREHLHVTKRSGNTVTKEEDFYYGTDNCSYSFVIPPRSIQRQECEYMFTIKAINKEKYVFDTIKARYYDERNKEHYFQLRKIEDCWNKKLYPIDEEWMLFK